MIIEPNIINKTVNNNYFKFCYFSFVTDIRNNNSYKLIQQKNYEESNKF